MQRIKKLTAIILSILTLSSVCVFGGAFSAGASGTGAGLAEWALNAYYEGWSYVYGGSTPGAVDCSGLIYSYCGGERCGDPQLNTATARGSVSSGIPNVHGLGLWRPGHVGVYVGNGEVVEERGFNYGCQLTKLKGRGWQHWYKLPFIKYPENTPIEPPHTSTYKLGDRLLKSGRKGEDVKELQSNLITLGYNLSKYGADGDYGSETIEAVKAFQEEHDLNPDGEYGPLSHQAMMSALADLTPDPDPAEDPTKPENDKLIVTGGSVRVRKGDNTTYAIITTVFKDAQLTPVRDENGKPIKSANGWYAVVMSEEIGWISGKYIK